MNTRRTLSRAAGIAAAIAVAALVLTACAPPAPKQSSAPKVDVPKTPSKPVSLNIIDGGGKVAVETAINAFVAANPDVVSSVTWESVSEGDVAGALKPQVDSGDLKVDLVITGSSGLSAGIANKLWVPIADQYGDRLSNMKNYKAEGKELQKLTDGQGAAVVYCYCGPTIEYNPSAVPASELPKSPEELLAWAAAHPGKFGYARPANSGVGRTFLLALPYLLGDKDPNDPVKGWDKTWAYLEKLGKYIDNYPTSTSQSMQNLANGTWTLMPSSAGWDVGPRARDQVPATMGGYALDKKLWLMDPNYALVPRGVSKDKLSALLLLINYILSPEGNATVGTSGQYIPGVIVDNVKDSMVPAATKELLTTYDRDWLGNNASKVKFIAPPKQEVVVDALDLWDRKIGAAH